MKWTELDKLMRDRVMDKLSDEERLWCKGLLERMHENAVTMSTEAATTAANEAIRMNNDDWERRINKWWSDNGWSGTPWTGGRPVQQASRRQVVVHRREPDDRNVFERGVDFIFGE